MESHRIRRLFLQFFADRGHRTVPSSSLVPADDPTLLFTNAGMVQFKRTFQGQEHRDYARAVTCQKCVRAGGKHNDLEQVGLTRRHHTFFEMLGNFSFGDYFKREAIAFAWELVTSGQYLGIHPDRLYVTVHHTDEEARVLWREVTGLGEGRVFGLGDADNFWQMGDTGPCGPCSEIYVDLERPGGGNGGRRERTQAEFEALAEAGQLLEIWNLVFMQFDRGADGALTPLPRPSVDTGAGLERIAAVLQRVDDNFHTDLFRPLLDRAGELVGAPYPGGLEGTGPSYRVLADHARAVAFLLADGVYPSNEGRGYVLRRILRRAVRHAWLLGRREPTLAPLAELVVGLLGAVYPELVEKQTLIRDVTTTEEHRFLETIEGGLRRLEDLFATGAAVIPGDEAFRLYDTYGFPVDLTELIAAERGVGVDTAGFERALEVQRRRSRTARRAGGGPGAPAVRARSGRWRPLRRGRQKFVGYETTEAETDILAVREGGERVDLLLHRNPFYAEAGGQVSDTGVVEGPGWSLTVDSVTREERGVAVSGPWEGDFAPDTVQARVAAPRRRNIERNHSATHLVHWALRRHLGDHVRQQGSLVEPDRLRFDFSHHGPIEPSMLERIEREVNEQIWENLPVETREMAYPEALALGAMAFFADKYGDRVRVVIMGPSIELCGGTHVGTTGALGLFRVTAQTGVAAGVRRIEAVTGPVAYRELDRLEDRLEEVAAALKATPEQVARRVEQLLADRARLEARLAELVRREGAAPPAGERHEVGGVAVVVAETAAEDRDEVGRLADRFRSDHRSAALVLYGTGERGAIHVALTDDLVQRGLRAGDLLNRIAAASGGRGGGRPGFASGSVGDAARAGAARAAIPERVAEWLDGR
jgi:alanyl-tRNA synthetase